jgi:AcrR family transcriptional regulator
MANETRRRPRLTAKGERTRARIVAAAAALIYERGVAGTTLDDVRTAAEVSGSQLSHYFAGKDELVQAVIDHQADVVVGNQEQADLGTIEGIKASRDMVISAARSADSSATPAPWKPPSTPSSPSPPPDEPARFQRGGGTRPTPRAKNRGGAGGPDRGGTPLNRCPGRASGEVVSFLAS